jgi:hypothetical protein
VPTSNQTLVQQGRSKYNPTDSILTSQLLLVGVQDSIIAALSSVFDVSVLPQRTLHYEPPLL